MIVVSDTSPITNLIEIGRLEAKKQGLIVAIKPEIERLISHADFWVSAVVV